MLQKMYYVLTVLCVIGIVTLLFMSSQKDKILAQMIADEMTEMSPQLDVIEIVNPGVIPKANTREKPLGSTIKTKTESINPGVIPKANNSEKPLESTIITQKESNLEPPKDEGCNCPFDYHYKDQCVVEVASKEQSAINKGQRDKEAKAKPQCAEQCKDIPSSFKVSLNSTNRDIYLDLMDIFDRTLDGIGVPYFLSGGSMLGLYRHHGFIPWDDDIDLFVPWNKKAEAEAALKKLPSKYRLDYTLRKRNWKFSLSTSPKMKRYNWRWPFVDIWGYEENSTHVIGFEPSKRYYYLKSQIFPLKKRPFCDLQINTGKNLTYMMVTRYKAAVINECAARTWSHQFETVHKNTGVTKIPCSTFDHVYPHVVYSKNGTYEEIKIGDRVLRSYKTVS